jgi:hypothetical protein
MIVSGNYLDPDVAYLLGLISARGILQETYDDVGYGLTLAAQAQQGLSVDPPAFSGRTQSVSAT